MENNYFEIFNLPEDFAVDLNRLNANYFALQQQFHPDKNPSFATKAAQINLAYNTLKNRLKRAEYMAGDNLQACPALLLEIMELRETGDVEDAKKQLEEQYEAFANASSELRKKIFVKIKYLTKFIDDAE